MGAQDFGNEYRGTATVGEAYSMLVDQAAWEHGHGGYTGTIAESRGYELDPGVTEPLTDAQLQEHLTDWWSKEESPEKWGPAWAIPLAPNPDWVDPSGGRYAVVDGRLPGWYFYGMASC